MKNKLENMVRSLPKSLLAVLMAFTVLMSGCSSAGTEVTNPVSPTSENPEVETPYEDPSYEGTDYKEAPEETPSPEISTPDSLDEGTNQESNAAEVETESETTPVASDPEPFDLSSIPAYSDSPYVVINGNVPYFADSDLSTTSFEYYSDLDSFGRCGTCVSCVGQDIMPTEARESISEVTPSGWKNVDYADVVDGGWLYNRCHLLGFQLTAENANEKNLITGTRYMNVDGMLPFENMVADYVQETNHHVLYRVTPIFEGNNLVASGVLMEAKSVEDNGDGILFCVYCYNVQPGISINYADGSSQLDGTIADTDSTPVEQEEQENDTSAISETTYVLNTNTKKFHYPSCSSVSKMSEKNKQEYTGTREEIIAMGYDPCGHCDP